MTTELCCLGERETYYGDYQFLIPGAYYNDNDTDQDGIEDYLGTHCIDLKDDRNAMLSVTTYAKYTGNVCVINQADVPKKILPLQENRLELDTLSTILISVLLESVHQSIIQGK